MLEILFILAIILVGAIGIAVIESLFRWLCNWSGLSATVQYPHRVGTELPRILNKA